MANDNHAPMTSSFWATEDNGDCIDEFVNTILERTFKGMQDVVRC